MNRKSMRKPSVLYKLVLDEFIDARYYPSGYNGICFVLQILYTNSIMSYNEKTFMRDHLHSQKPSMTQHQEFYRSQYFCGEEYWWRKYVGDVSVHSRSNIEREKFLKKMIEITEHL